MRFNFTFRKAQPDTVNHEGAAASTLTPQLELYAAVATAALSDQFYEKADTRLARLRGLVARNDPTFVAQLAVYAREQMYLRSVPLVLAVELARLHHGDSLVSCLVARIVQRPDEITELLACYAQVNQRTGGENPQPPLQAVAERSGRQLQSFRRLPAGQVRPGRGRAAARRAVSGASHASQ